MHGLFLFSMYSLIFFKSFGIIFSASGVPKTPVIKSICIYIKHKKFITTHPKRSHSRYSNIIPDFSICQQEQYIISVSIKKLFNVHCEQNRTLSHFSWSAREWKRDKELSPFFKKVDFSEMEPYKYVPVIFGFTFDTEAIRKSSNSFHLWD